MIAFPSMLKQPAIEAGIKVPQDPNNYEPDDYKHFHAFCILQLGRSMKMDGEQWRNAKIIAKVPEDKIKAMTLEDFLVLGLEWQN